MYVGRIRKGTLPCLSGIDFVFGSKMFFWVMMRVRLDIGYLYGFGKRVIRLTLNNYLKNIHCFLSNIINANQEEIVE